MRVGVSACIVAAASAAIAAGCVPEAVERRQCLRLALPCAAGPFLWLPRSPPPLPTPLERRLTLDGAFRAPAAAAAHSLLARGGGTAGAASTGRKGSRCCDLLKRRWTRRTAGGAGVGAEDAAPPLHGASPGRRGEESLSESEAVRMSVLVASATVVAARVAVDCVGHDGLAAGSSCASAPHAAGGDVDALGREDPREHAGCLGLPSASRA